MSFLSLLKILSWNSWFHKRNTLLLTRKTISWSIRSSKILFRHLRCLGWNIKLNLKKLCTNRISLTEIHKIFLNYLFGNINKFYNSSNLSSKRAMNLKELRRKWTFRVVKSKICMILLIKLLVFLKFIKI